MENKPILEEEKEEAWSIMQNYLKELSEWDQTIEFDNDGFAIYKWFDFYWKEDDRFPFFLCDNDKVYGLALVRKLKENKYEFSEFYITPDFRGNKHALSFAEQIVDNFGGDWELSCITNNERAIKFWKKFCEQYDNCEHSDQDEKQIWKFSSKKLYKASCVFCKIIKGELPCYKIYEDEYTLAFLDIADDCMGHTLVIPKIHNKNILDIPQDAYLKVMETVKKLSEHYVNNCGFDGVNIISAANIEAQQSVMHFHIHILPRSAGDEINAWPELDKKYQDFEKVCKKIRLIDN